MESQGSTEATSYAEFLQKFCLTRKNELKESSPLPFRICINRFTKKEAEGEVMEWLREFLSVEKCPEILAMALVRVVTDSILSQDLDTLMERDDDMLKKEGNTEIDNKALEDGQAAVKTPSEKRISSHNIMRVAANKLYQTCHEWNTKLPSHLVANKHIEYSMHAIKNGRRKMEDRHVTVPSLNLLFDLPPSPQQAFFAIFDGHGGTEAAIYSAAHLLCNTVRHEAFSMNPAKAFMKGFPATDEDFLLRAKEECLIDADTEEFDRWMLWRHSWKQNLNCGSTGVCALIQGRHCYLAWLGDSSALLVRNNQPVEIMNPHKPGREDEKERIENLGGCVVWFGTWRVNGNLSVSRAIGDIQHKPYVSNKPDINQFHLDGTENYLVLACDGLWDVVDGPKCVEVMNDHMKNSDNNRSTSAHALVRYAREMGSTDNISVIVVFFNHDENQDAESSEASSSKLSADDRESSFSEKPSESEGGKDEGSEKDKKNESNLGSSKGSQPSQNQSSSCDTPELSRGSQSTPMPSSGSSLPEISFHGRRISKSDSNKPVKSSSRDESLSFNRSHSRSKSVSTNRSKSVSTNRSKSVSTNRSRSSNGMRLADIHSDTSLHSELGLLTKSGNRCSNNRKAKRSKNGRNGRTKENKRAFRGRMGGNLLTTYSSSKAPPRSRSAESNLSLAQKNMMRSENQIFELLTGCSTDILRKVKSMGKWTVAVEMENAAAMFEVEPETPTPTETKGRRQSDITHMFSSKK